MVEFDYFPPICFAFNFFWISSINWFFHIDGGFWAEIIFYDNTKFLRIKEKLRNLLNVQTVQTDIRGIASPTMLSYGIVVYLVTTKITLYSN